MRTSDYASWIEGSAYILNFKLLQERGGCVYALGSHAATDCHPRACGDPVRRGFSAQSMLPLEYWVARSSRAMTIEYAVTISRHQLSEVYTQLPALQSQGRREDRVLAAPAVSRAICA